MKSKIKKIKMLEEKLEMFKEYEIFAYGKKVIIVNLIGGIAIETPMICKGLSEYSNESIDYIIEKLRLYYKELGV